MPNYNFSLIETEDQRETFDNIAFIHTLIHESVKNMGGDDYDYDDCLDLLYRMEV